MLYSFLTEAQNNPHGEANREVLRSQEDRDAALSPQLLQVQLGKAQNQNHCC